MFTYVRVKGETTMFGLQEIKAMNEAHVNGKKINEVITHKNFVRMAVVKY